jgi:hypothetical protein
MSSWIALIALVVMLMYGNMCLYLNACFDFVW